MFNLVEKLNRIFGKNSTKKVLIAKNLLRDFLKKLRNLILDFFQFGKVYIFGYKARHLIICGCSRSGTTLLYNMMRSSVSENVNAPPTEISACFTRNIFSDEIITKRPLDLFEIGEIHRDFGRYRDLYFTILKRDPRDLISSIHQNVDNQFFQGIDYQFFISDKVKSFCNPGVFAAYEATQQDFISDLTSVSKIKYEEIVQDPEKIRQLLESFSKIHFEQPFENFYKSDIPETLLRALNGIRPVKAAARPPWTEPDRLAHVYRQIRLFPVIEDICSVWGYSDFFEELDKFGLAVPTIDEQRGTIVAYHTDDLLYRSEAKRFCHSLNRLGLPFDLTVIPAGKGWLSNCARKPEIIADARNRLSGPLLYIDVDAFVHIDPWPYLSQYNGDISCYVDRFGELYSGTIWVNDTTGAREVLKKWCEAMRRYPAELDQNVLRDLLISDENAKERKYNSQRLPRNMTYIFDGYKDYFYGNIFIEHLQASRDKSNADRLYDAKNDYSRLVRISKIDLNS